LLCIVGAQHDGDHVRLELEHLGKFSICPIAAIAIRRFKHRRCGNAFILDGITYPVVRQHCMERLRVIIATCDTVADAGDFSLGLEWRSQKQCSQETNS
jgi:hypothetical protein